MKKLAGVRIKPEQGIFSVCRMCIVRLRICPSPCPLLSFLLEHFVPFTMAQRLAALGRTGWSKLASRCCNRGFSTVLSCAYGGNKQTINNGRQEPHL